MTKKRRREAVKQRGHVRYPHERLHQPEGLAEGYRQKSQVIRV